MNRGSRYWMFFLFLLFFLPGLAGLAVEVFNRFFREVASPFLAPGLGFAILSFFFLVKRSWQYLLLSCLMLAYIAASFLLGLWNFPPHLATSQCYRQWSFDTASGRLRLQAPLGKSPPTHGAYITCNFTLKDGWDYLDNQADLCTAFTANLQILMFLHDQETDSGTLREFQLNQFQLQSKSLLGEPIDRGALRLAYWKNPGLFRPGYTLKTIYQVHERELSPEQSRIIETFTRDGQGRLKSFTESSALNETSRDVFAVYNAEGLLKEIPRLLSSNFIFPAKIDVREIERLSLPAILTSEMQKSSELSSSKKSD